jgi:enoyl-CoA hydratase/carnithine racemase
LQSDKEIIFEGHGKDHELCLTGEMITAEEAQRIGLVNRIRRLAGASRQSDFIFAQDAFLQLNRFFALCLQY